MNKTITMKRVLTIVLVWLFFPATVLGQTTTYVVQPGDSMWKIAVKYQVGLSEIINANPQVENPRLIYPNQKLNIPGVGQDIRAAEKEVIRLCNIERQKNGLKPLVENWELSRVARIKSQDMAQKNYFSHTSPTYGSPFTMLTNFGITYRSAGENIAKGQRSAQEVVKSWMASAGHRQNILNPNFTEIGVGLEQAEYHWTQLFIQK
ncbi:SafA/ExsA family spore coat assembly protein [Dehalobacter sp. DCM]|uniref:SafA/ExsA family spore coat assembly protein n=1 Tax=Dehalobacter sp. DCM TaxID=2907827 RepID=UPI003FCDDF14